MSGRSRGAGRVRKVVALGVGIVLVVGLVGACDRPGVAATVDGTSVSTDELAGAVRDLAAAVPGQTVSTAVILTGIALAPTVSTVASDHGAGVSDDQARSWLSQIASQYNGTVSAGPGALAFARYEVVMQAASSSTDTTLSADLTAALKAADVSVNPRFGTWDAATGSIASPTAPAWIVATPTATPTA